MGGNERRFQGQSEEEWRQGETLPDSTIDRKRVQDDARDNDEAVNIFVDDLKQDLARRKAVCATTFLMPEAKELMRWLGTEHPCRGWSKDARKSLTARARMEASSFEITLSSVIYSSWQSRRDLCRASVNSAFYKSPGCRHAGRRQLGCCTSAHQARSQMRCRILSADRRFQGRLLISLLSELTKPICVLEECE